MIQQTSRGWNWPLRSDIQLEDLARMFNPIIQGWINYYSRYYKSALYLTLKCLERRLIMWAMRIQTPTASSQTSRTVVESHRAETALCLLAGDCCMPRLDDRSRMSGDVHVWFCEHLEGKFLWATRLVSLLGL